MHAVIDADIDHVWAVSENRLYVRVFGLASGWALVTEKVT
jgi:hypothetical protein